MLGQIGAHATLMGHVGQIFENFVRTKMEGFGTFMGIIPSCRSALGDSVPGPVGKVLQVRVSKTGNREKKLENEGIQRILLSGDYIPRSWLL